MIQLNDYFKKITVAGDKIENNAVLWIIIRVLRMSENTFNTFNVFFFTYWIVKEVYDVLKKNEV